MMQSMKIDCVARQDVERFIEGFINEYTSEEELELINLALDGLKHIPSATPQEPFINKPCVSSEVCEHDKQKILDKIRAEIRAYSIYVMPQHGRTIREADVLHIIDKYKAETEAEDGNDD